MKKSELFGKCLLAIDNNIDNSIWKSPWDHFYKSDPDKYICENTINIIIKRASLTGCWHDDKIIQLFDNIKNEWNIDNKFSLSLSRTTFGQGGKGGFPTYIILYFNIDN